MSRSQRSLDYTPWGHRGYHRKGIQEIGKSQRTLNETPQGYWGQHGKAWPKFSLKRSTESWKAKKSVWNSLGVQRGFPYIQWISHETTVWSLSEEITANPKKKFSLAKHTLAMCLWSADKSKTNIKKQPLLFLVCYEGMENLGWEEKIARFKIISWFFSAFALGFSLAQWPRGNKMFSSNQCVWNDSLSTFPEFLDVQCHLTNQLSSSQSSFPPWQLWWLDFCTWCKG